MTKLNTGTRLRTAPLKTEAAPSGKTHEGAPGYAREERSELFMRATTVFAGEGAFYENAKTADDRAAALVRILAVTDWRWVAGFLPWLRAEANIRTSAVKLAVDGGGARTKEGIAGRETSQVMAKTMLRGDEPGEFTQYALREFGKLPVQHRLAAAAAARELYTERAVLRWDKPDRPMRFADVIEIAHPKPKDAHQAALFRYLLDARHHGNFPDAEGYGAEPPRRLGMIHARWELSRLSPPDRHALAAEALKERKAGGEEGPATRQIRLAAAGQWEWVTSWLGEGAKTTSSALSERERWELVIPWMGYMALLRNLRNFDQAGVRDKVKDQICARLADPKEVELSRQLPFRFLSAHLNTRGADWVKALERALHASIANVPVLGGRTLILIDTSGSMQAPLSQRPGRIKGTPPVLPDRVKAAALFGLALALKNAGKVDVYGFASGYFEVANIEQGGSLLRTADLFARQVGRVGHGTEIEASLRATFDPRRHTRVALFTDMQAFSHSYRDVACMIPATVPVYAWNLAGYQHSAMAAGSNRVELAGLSDASFSLMQRYEARQSGLYPWDYEAPRAVDDEDEDE